MVSPFTGEFTGEEHAMRPPGHKMCVCTIRLNPLPRPRPRSFSTTANQGPAKMQPWAVGEVVNVGGVSVRPGDYIIGDQDGVVVVPEAVSADVLKIATEREAIEDVIKQELIDNPGPPGLYYPFKPPIARESPLGLLLKRKGLSGSVDAK